MDRETRELLDALEKTNARMLTTLSRVLAGDAEKADQRARMVCLAQRETTRAVYWLTVVVALVVTVAALWGHH